MTFTMRKLATILTASCLWLCCVVSCAARSEVKAGGGKETGRAAGIGNVAPTQQGVLNVSYVGMGVATLLLWLGASLLRERINQKHETERLKLVLSSKEPRRVSEEVSSSPSRCG